MNDSVGRLAIIGFAENVIESVISADGVHSAVDGSLKLAAAPVTE